MVRMREALKNGLEPFEKGYELAKDQAQYKEVARICAENLKSMYFNLRNEDPAYEAAYQKYVEILAQ